jgi:hypothetical protein
VGGVCFPRQLEVTDPRICSLLPQLSQQGTSRSAVLEFGQGRVCPTRHARDVPKCRGFTQSTSPGIRISIPATIADASFRHPGPRHESERTYAGCPVHSAHLCRQPTSLERECTAAILIRNASRHVDLDDRPKAKLFIPNSTELYSKQGHHAEHWLAAAYQRIVQHAAQVQWSRSTRTQYAPDVVLELTGITQVAGHA